VRIFTRSQQHCAVALAAIAGITVLGACSPASSNSSAPGSGGNYKYTSTDPSLKGTDATTLDSLFSGLEKPSKQLRFGVVLKTLTNEYWQEVERGMNAAAQKYGVDLTVQASAGESAQSQQLSIAQTMIAQPFDAFLVSPESTSNLTPAIKQMQAKGVPIVNVEDARVDATTFVGPASLVEGGRAGEYIASQLPQGGKVAQIEGQAGSDAADLRIRGFEAAVKKAGNLQLVASVPGDWDASKAYDDATSLLKANPDLAAIYANNDTMALGVVKAVADAGRTGRVIVMGTDGIPSAIKAVRDGSLSGTTTPQPYSQGYWAVQCALALVEKRDVPPFVLTSAVLVDKTNVADMYTGDGLQSVNPK
jgi:ABC-type sugar transport system substrate-binding protein